MNGYGYGGNRGGGPSRRPYGDRGGPGRRPDGGRGFGPRDDRGYRGRASDPHALARGRQGRSRRGIGAPERADATAGRGFPRPRGIRPREARPGVRRRGRIPFRKSGSSGFAGRSGPSRISHGRRPEAGPSPPAALGRAPANIARCVRGAVPCARDAVYSPVAAAETVSRAELWELLVLNRRRERSERESTTLGQTDVREVQDHPAQRPGPRYLLESAPQAKARLRWPVSRVSTSRSTSASRLA